MAPGRCALTAGGTPPPAVPGAGPPVAGPPVAGCLRAGGVERRWRVPVAAGRGVKGRTGVRAGNRERRWRSWRVRRWRGCRRRARREGGSGRVSRDAYIYISRRASVGSPTHHTSSYSVHEQNVRRGRRARAYFFGPSPRAHGGGKARAARQKAGARRSASSSGNAAPAPAALALAPASASRTEAAAHASAAVASAAALRTRAPASARTASSVMSSIRSESSTRLLVQNSQFLRLLVPRAEGSCQEQRREGAPDTAAPDTGAAPSHCHRHGVPSALVGIRSAPCGASTHSATSEHTTLLCEHTTIV